ncbi:MAG: hypothetical protein JWQ20_3473 [Conexibacter sp.]|nr:hypothetical protein [Conexibacter sp.]
MTSSARGLRLGVVADDVTGACDLAGRVVEARLPTTVTLGVPSAGAPLFPGEGSGCAVVALKVRTVPAREAADAAGESAERLLEAGASLLYQKYCSTFDSTAQGNIGPVADAIATVAGTDAITIGTPATPGAGRIQQGGQLIVDGAPLAESPMRNHPLTPMRQSDVARLLRAQTPERVAAVSQPGGGADELAERIRQLTADGVRHLLPDAVDEHDLDTIARAILSLADERSVVAAGGAGVATALARSAVAGPAVAGPAVAGSAADEAASSLDPVPDGGRLILSGSASAATRAQNDAFEGERITIDPYSLSGDAESERTRLCSELAASLAGGTPVLVTATASPDRVAQVQHDLGTHRAADLIESALADLAAHAVGSLGVTRLIVAGGETSGAVVAALGIDRLRVGEQAAPGVPWTTGTALGHPVALLLKSGNFGDDDLFTRAWGSAP